MANKPDCYQCKFREQCIGDAHSQCKNWKAKVKGDLHGVRNGWFCWPFNFDPTWLISCTGFKKKIVK